LIFSYLAVLAASVKVSDSFIHLFIQSHFNTAEVCALLNENA